MTEKGDEKQESQVGGQEVDFNGLVLSLSAAALHYIGHEVIEGTPAERNLLLAKQNIDILCVIKDKTAGNLTDEEASLLNQALSDLQQKYAKAAGAL